MCGIFGMAFQKGHDMNNAEEVKYILDSLLVESQARGSDASGVALVSSAKTSVVKHRLPASKLIETDFYKESVERFLWPIDKSNTKADPIMILGHTRFKTKGTPLNRDNNHPIVSNKIVGVHNGVIGNDDMLFNRFIGKFPGSFRRKAKVDSEIIFRLINHYSNKVNHNMVKSIKATSRILEGSYACALVNIRASHMLWLFRCTMPIEVRHYSNHGFIIFASSDRFIKSAVKDIISEKGVDIKVGASSALGINLLQNRQIKFDIPTDKANAQSYSDYYKGMM